ncbi:MAG TPA: oligopeptide/dipeptide ABC transporter ATP-binding protein [Alphaproteobacteria bacterium]|nr:oligopeptide/dipeptide ABC transporter ATP-binding protein [Alphaproteobacteria bacterium]
MAEPLIAVHDLYKHFPMRLGGILSRRVTYVRAVDGVSFEIHRGETIGLVGESGSGKSTVGRLLVRLLDPTRGEIVFDGHNLAGLTAAQLRPLRRHMQMVFQDPFSSLNPRRTVGESVGYPLKVQRVCRSKRELQERVRQLFEVVGLEPYFMNRYPHEFSGGQRQRIGIARALALNPQFVILDEPVSALDVSIQAQVLTLLQELQERFHLTYLFISHDLNVVEYLSTRVMVMYLGKIVEVASAEELYRQPLHPYSQALLSANPPLNPDATSLGRIVLQGEIPSPLAVPSGCRFRTRCPMAMPQCTAVEPPLLEVAPGHQVACHAVL